MANSIFIQPWQDASVTNIIISGTGYFADGSAAAPSRAYTLDTDLGSYRIGANNEGFSAGGTLRWDYNTTRILSTIPLLFTDGGPSIGASGATRPLHGFFAGGIALGTNPATIAAGWVSLPNATGVAGRNAANNANIVLITTTSSNNVDVGSADALNIRFQNDLLLGNVLLVSKTAPTIASGFGTSPSIVASNGTAAFTIDVGTGGVASSGVITLPAATTGWVLNCVNITNAATSVVSQTAGTTTSATITNYSRTTGLAAAWTASDILRISATAY